MRHVSFFIDHIGTAEATTSWDLYKQVNVQRLHYVKGGSGYMKNDKGDTFALQVGHIYIFPYNMRQQFVTDPDDRVDHFFIDFVSSPPIISSSVLDYDLSVCSPHIQKIVEILDQMVKDEMYNADFLAPAKRIENIVDAAHGSAEERNQAMYALVESLFILLSAEKEIPYSDDSVLSEALTYINTRYNTDIRIDELAANAGYSTAHFIRRFRAIMGISPYAYLHNYRLCRACEFISGGMSVSKAAELVGYKNASSLSRELAKFQNRH